MNNYKFKLRIKASDIYERINPEQRPQFSDVMITKATLIDDDSVIIDCLAVAGETKEVPYLQILSDNDGYINITS